MPVSIDTSSSVENVVVWLESLTEWVGDVETTADLFEDAGIDGSLLSTISADELEALVGISDAAEVAALIAARDVAFAGGLLGSVEDVLKAGHPTSGSQRELQREGGAGKAAE